MSPVRFGQHPPTLSERPLSVTAATYILRDKAAPLNCRPKSPPETLRKEVSPMSPELRHRRFQQRWRSYGRASEQYQRSLFSALSIVVKWNCFRAAVWQLHSQTRTCAVRFCSLYWIDAVDSFPAQLLSSHQIHLKSWVTRCFADKNRVPASVKNPYDNKCSYLTQRFPNMGWGWLDYTFPSFSRKFCSPLCPSPEWPTLKPHWDSSRGCQQAER